MLRKQTRRSFTVEVKQSAISGRSVIPAKLPRAPHRARASASEARSVFQDAEAAIFSPVVASKAEEPRRILPSLIVWEPPEPEGEATIDREPPLPRVRRVAPVELGEAGPRRRGRPRKVPLNLGPQPFEEPEPCLPAPSASPAPDPAPVSVRSLRVARIESTVLPRSERWKRRLPRACW